MVMRETIASIAIRLNPGRYRLGDIADLDGRLGRLLDARPHAAAHPAEQRRAIRGALVDADARERALEHRGEDRAPQRAAPAAAAEPRARHVSADQIRGVAQREGDALEHRA